MKILDDLSTSAHRRRRNNTKARLDALDETLRVENDNIAQQGGLEAKFMTQINVSDSRIRRDSARTSFRDDVPFVNDITPITDAKCLSYAVIGNQYTYTLISEKRDNTPDPINRNGVYARKRFIQQDELGSRCESASNF